MRFRRRLRSRIIFSFLLLGTLLSVLFAVAVLSLQSYLEDQLIGATLAQELDDYVRQLREDPSVVEPFYTRIQGYVTRPGDPNRSVSAQVRNLATGVHDVDIGGVAYKAAVRKDEDLWAFLIYNVSDNRQVTRQLVVYLVGGVLRVMFWWRHRATRRALARSGSAENTRPNASTTKITTMIT